jgi:uroporphyrinogen-III synthase
VLTRDDDDDRELAEELRVLRARVAVAPCIRTEPLDDRGAFAGELAALGADDLVVVTSPAGAAAIGSSGASLAAPVATVGLATAERLRAHGITPAFVARTPSAVALGGEVPLPRGTVLLARSDRATAELPAILRGRGARVREVIAYRTVVAVSGEIDLARDAIAAGDRPVVVFASPSAVDGFVGEVGSGSLADARIVAIGPTTARRVTALTDAPATVAPTPDVLGLVSAIVTTARNKEKIHAHAR